MTCARSISLIRHVHNVPRAACQHLRDNTQILKHSQRGPVIVGARPADWVQARTSGVLARGLSRSASHAPGRGFLLSLKAGSRRAEHDPRSSF